MSKGAGSRSSVLHPADGSDHPTEPLWRVPEPGAPTDSEHTTRPLWGEPEPGAPTGFEPPGPPPGTPASPAPRPGPRHRLSAGLAALLIAIGAIAGAGVARLTTHEPTPTATSQGTSSGTAQSGQGPGSGVLPGDGNAASDLNVDAVAAAVSPAVVDINITIGYQDGEAAGTGMVLTSDGVVLTNNHVIAGATRISVTDVGNDKTYTARVVGYDRTHDIAVLKLEGASGLKTVTIGDSSDLSVGAAVLAVGNGGGTGGTPSTAAGTVTALDQQITASDQSNGTSQTYTGLIQTDADIVPGYSGGPLVDAHGRVIGINTAASAGFRFQFSGTEGFAIPINTAMGIVHQIESGNSSSTVHIGDTAMLGVSIRTAGDGSFDQPDGALVADVVSGGPADQAGLAAGDVITALDGRTVTSAEDLTAAILNVRPGSSVTVDYTTSDGQQRTTTVGLTSGPPQ